MSTSGKKDSATERMRLFVAFPFPKGFWKDVEALQKLNTGITNLRWTQLQNLHVTIFFLGEVRASDLDKIKDKIRDEVYAAVPFIPEFEKISPEKGRRHSGMIWMRFLKDEKFSSLSNGLKKSLEEFLLHPVTVHDPLPHITLARWKGYIDIEKLSLQFDSGFKPPEINFCELWQSVSTAEGVRYKSLERFEMK